jgi:hypothetical protein
MKYYLILSGPLPQGGNPMELEEALTFHKYLDTNSHKIDPFNFIIYSDHSPTTIKNNIKSRMVNPVHEFLGVLSFTMPFDVDAPSYPRLMERLYRQAAEDCYQDSLRVASPAEAPSVSNE